MRRRLPEAGLAHPVLAEPLEVDVRAGELGLVAEAMRLGQPGAVLVDEGVSVPRQVRGRFAGEGYSLDSTDPKA